jgi:hypothetical protein
LGCKKKARIKPAKVVKPANILQVDLHPCPRPPLVHFRRRSLGAPASRSTLPHSEICHRSFIGVPSEFTKIPQTINYSSHSDRFLIRMLVPVDFRSNWRQFDANLDEIALKDGRPMRDCGWQEACGWRAGGLAARGLRRVGDGREACGCLAGGGRQPRGSGRAAQWGDMRRGWALPRGQARERRLKKLKI